MSAETAVTGEFKVSSSSASGKMEDDGASVQAAQPPQLAANPANAPPNATFTIQPPEAFDFSKPQEWKRWIMRFERFRLASNLHLSSQAN